jgi:hypothetical protein
MRGVPPERAQNRNGRTHGPRDGLGAILRLRPAAGGFCARLAGRPACRQLTKRFVAVGGNGGPAAEPFLLPGLFRSVMWTETVFWGALAAGFLILALSAHRGRKAVVARTNPPNVIVSIGGIDTPVGIVLASLLRVEMAGFMLAGAAAIFSAVV